MDDLRLGCVGLFHGATTQALNTFMEGITTGRIPKPQVSKSAMNIASSCDQKIQSLVNTILNMFMEIDVTSVYIDPYDIFPGKTHCSPDQDIIR